VVANGISTILDEDLSRACFDALQLKRNIVRRHALSYSWHASTQQFLGHLHLCEKTTLCRWPRSHWAEVPI
jgi:hypothetical protein